jgi:hypothetical protein
VQGGALVAADDRTHNHSGAAMYAQTASKITAFAVAVLLNSLVFVGVGYVLSEPSQVRAKASACIEALMQLPDFVRA